MPSPGCLHPLTDIRGEVLIASEGKDGGPSHSPKYLYPFSDALELNRFPLPVLPFHHAQNNIVPSDMNRKAWFRKKIGSPLLEDVVCITLVNTLGPYSGAIIIVTVIYGGEVVSVKIKDLPFRIAMFYEGKNLLPSIL